MGVEVGRCAKNKSSPAIQWHGSTRNWPSRQRPHAPPPRYPHTYLQPGGWRQCTHEHIEVIAHLPPLLAVDALQAQDRIPGGACDGRLQTLALQVV